MEEVVRNMLARDLRITVASPAFSATGTVSAFSISFSYSDRFKAQQTVQALMNKIDELYMDQQIVNASRSLRLHVITQRKEGEVLDVLDTASLPWSPVSPNRLVIASIGLGVGLLIGAVVIWFQRPRSMMPEIQKFGGIEAV